MIQKSAFKAYDIRGKYPEEVNEDLAYQLAHAFVVFYQAQKVIIGRDIRLTSQGLVDSLIEGFNDAGCDVIDIGLCGTEQVYHCTSAWNADGGIMVTASHNPMEYNGLKLVREKSIPISLDSGLLDLYQMIQKKPFPKGVAVGVEKGSTILRDSTEDYIDYLLNLVPAENFLPLKIVANAGNGCAGPVMEALGNKLPIEWIPLFYEPDGTFPNGIPNPLLEEKRATTAAAILEHQADLGIAWDGDFDRCFLFDHQGRFIDSYYLVGFLAEIFLEKEPGSTIIYDPRVIWNTEEVVREAGGNLLESRGGHAFMKETMRKVGAIYGGESSGHHFFRDFHQCDSGMLPWLFIVSELCRKRIQLADVVEVSMQKFPISGEINRVVEDARAVIQNVESLYSPLALRTDYIDGLSVEFSDWRFNLRSSNTEPVIRLNVESRGNIQLLTQKTEELLTVIGGVPYS